MDALFPDMHILWHSEHQKLYATLPAKTLGEEPLMGCRKGSGRNVRA